MRAAPAVAVSRSQLPARSDASGQDRIFRERPADELHDDRKTRCKSDQQCQRGQPDRHQTRGPRHCCKPYRDCGRTRRSAGCRRTVDVGASRRQKCQNRCGELRLLAQGENKNNESTFAFDRGGRRAATCDMAPKSSSFCAANTMPMYGLVVRSRFSGVRLRFRSPPEALGCRFCSQLRSQRSVAFANPR